MTEEQGKILLRLARNAIAKELGERTEEIRKENWLNESGATFVTIMHNGELRGCIGSIEARRSLGEDVEENAVAAALKDYRFPPLEPDELDGTEIEVSLLSPLTELTFSNEEEAIAQLRPGIDGVVFKDNHVRSTFLPQVWEKLPDARKFLTELKLKAGLAPNFWSPEVRLYRYAVTKWREKDL
ncbi:MAG TPA: AmmeMemoRadiSam system protein A [Bdellovibrionota bacterium]|nr:AmmeMemoRadiSam system protein A [Bdellovibrionota bacterium]